MKFVDQTRITVISGAGGRGCMSFRHEPYVPRGGPDGGNGGKGGSVVLIGDSSLHTLLDCQYQQLYRARHGAHGSGNNRIGRSAPDLEILLPLGTQVYDDESGELIVDLDSEHARVVIAEGGRGGRGNAVFATSRNRAPRRFEEGKPGVERRLRLELKLIADVGLVGLPNSGKSTLISKVSNARPEIADYPFTTKVPGLGVVRASGVGFVIADIPGLIKGAHQGAGMGDRFLRHVERTRLLLHLVDPSPLISPEPLERFDIIMNELSAYSSDLAGRPVIAVITKLDLPENHAPAEELRLALAERGLPVYKISAATGEGLPELLKTVAKTLRSIRLHTT